MSNAWAIAVARLVPDQPAHLLAHARVDGVSRRRRLRPMTLMRGVRCGIRLSRSRHLMPALRPSGTPRRSRPSQSATGGRLGFEPRQQVAPPTMFTNRWLQPPSHPFQHRQVPPTSGSRRPQPAVRPSCPSEPASPRAAQSPPACGMTIRQRAAARSRESRWARGRPRRPGCLSVRTNSDLHGLKLSSQRVQHGVLGSRPSWGYDAAGLA